MVSGKGAPRRSTCCALPCEIFQDEPCHECAFTHHAVDLTRRHVSSGGGVEGVAAPRRCESGRFATMHTRRAVHSDGAGERSRKRAERAYGRELCAVTPAESGGGIQLTTLGTESTFEKPNYLRSGGQRRCRPIALSHVHGDHIAALCCGRGHLCHLEEQLPAEGAHSPRVRGEGLVLGVLRMRRGALLTGGGG